MGGSGKAVMHPHRIANLALLCGSATSPKGCHNHVENSQRRQAYADGWAIRRGLRTAEDVPILHHSLGFVLLTADGGYGEQVAA